MKYERLLKEAAAIPIKVYKHPMIPSIKGLYEDGVVLINSSLQTTTEQTCVLAEELGHYHTSSGNILDQADLRNRKQERRARGWAHHKLAPLDAFIEAFLSGVSGRHEIAEFMEISEPFLDEALAWYREKYGLFAAVDEYIIYFDPLAVAILFE